MSDKLKEIRERHEIHTKALKKLREEFKDKNHKPVTFLGIPAHQDRGELLQMVDDRDERIAELQSQVDAFNRSRMLSHKYAGCTADNCKLDGVECSQALEQKP